MLTESPAENQALDREWNTIADAQMVAWFTALGEGEMEA